MSGVAQAFTPTQDTRFIQADLGFPVPMKTAVPFQPFDESIQILVSGIAIGNASQNSSFLADGIVASGGGGAGSVGGFSPSTQSVVDSRFDLAQSSVFSLDVTLSSTFAPGDISFILEQTAPSAGVLVSLTGVATLDRLVGMPVGSYRLRAISRGGGGNGTGFGFDFRRVCESASAQDSDGDRLFDGCDLCPLNFDPGQEDTDGDGFGDACNDIIDPDGDEYSNYVDDCPFAFDPGQEDTDGDGFGDACNDAVDFDGDDYANTLDNCPADANPDQIDADYDTRGDVCDAPESIMTILQIDSFRSVSRVALAPDGTVYAAVSPSIYQIPPPAGPQVELINGLPIGAQFADVAVGPDGMVYTAGAMLGKSYRIPHAPRRSSSGPLPTA